MKNILKKTVTVALALILCLSAFAVVPFAATTGWDGKASTKPTGKGTAADPYLVSSAENLKWMSDNIKKGDRVNDQHADVIAGKYGPSFEGQYFEQTCDIDLGGKTLPSIGFYFANDKRMGAFGGIYDGNGFKIMNGTVDSMNNAHDLNFNWGHGLFGIIYGATVKNVTLDNVTVNGHGITGGIVGRAVTPQNNPAKANFNIVENCTVTNTCKITVNFPINKVSTKGDFDQASRVGGIVGMAYGTTVRNCKNSASISVPGNFNYGGGILGTGGFHVLVDHCINEGTVTLDVSKNANKAESGYGGIVGFVSPYSSGSKDKTWVGDLHITNCYNTGAFRFVGTASANAVYWGGILGGGNSLQPNGSYKISHCYNLNAENELSINYNNFRIGGLVGSYWIGDKADVAPIYMDHSYSVKLTKGGNTCGYNGTNEYRCWIRNNKNGKCCFQIGLTDGTFANALNGKYPANATVGTKTAEEIKALTAEIDKAVNQALDSSMLYLGSQQTVVENGKFSIRLIFGVEHLDWEKIGLKVTVNGKEKICEGTTVYNSVLQYKDGVETTTTAESLGANYLSTLTVQNIPAQGTYTITIEAYAVEGFGQTLIPNYGSAVTLTVSDGSFTD